MLKEFVEALSRLSVDAARPQVSDVAREKDVLVKNPDGTVRIVEGKPPYRSHKAKDLGTIAAFASRFSGSAIWYSRNEVVLLIDDADRRERVSISMDWSDQIKWLMDMEKSKRLVDQRKILQDLRTVLTPAAFQAAPKFIDLFKQIKFSAGSTTNADMQRGKASVGKEVMARVSFLAELPEMVTVSVPMFHNTFANKCYDVSCAVEIWEAEEKFQMFPLPGQVEKAFAAAEGDIADSIGMLVDQDADDGVKIYYGAP